MDLHIERRLLIIQIHFLNNILNRIAYLFWLILWVMVIMSEPAVATFAPCVECPVIKDTGAVGGATGCINNFLPLQTLHQLRSIHASAE